MTKGPPIIFDRKALALHRTRAQNIAGASAILQEAAIGLEERLRSVNRTFYNALAIDTLEQAMKVVEGTAGKWTCSTVGTDEALALDGAKFDLIVSLLSLQSVSDLPGVLAQILQHLTPDGLFVAAVFGGETLFELKDSFSAAEIETLGGVSPRVAPFADIRELGGLLQRAGFALPVADTERTVVRYRNFSTLVSDLRILGETNALAQRNRNPTTRKTLAAALRHYANRHADTDGRLRATFDIVYLTGWAPHESQQKPLKPGSALSRLADALNATEQSAGEPVPKR